MGTDWSSILTGATVYGVLSYMARTIPHVENVWARWIIGGVQYILANPDRVAPKVVGKADYNNLMQ